mmetsp:Transcript_22943/g.35360  ORF Transcript_22943/g.35360 Transcript_22943/m.35360 type:complete len:111 (+) Transcript_22943:683-1015(+)
MDKLNKEKKLKKKKPGHSKKKKKDELQPLPPPMIKPGLRCTRHKGQLVHSYLVSMVKPADAPKVKHTLLCTQCIFDMKLSTNQIAVIPSVIVEIRQQIESSKTLIFYRKS